VLTAARPGDTNLKRDLARVLSWQSRTADAADVFAEIVAQHLDDKDALLELSRLETRLGDVRRASELLRQYRDAGGDEQTYHRELAELPAQAALAAEGEKRWPKAEHTYREMLAGEPNRVDLLRRLADVLAAEGKTKQAAEILARAADRESEDGELQLRASEAFATANLPAVALKYVNRALARSPGDLELHQRRAKLATWAGDYKQAEASLRVLIAANPTDLSLNRDLGRVLSWQHEYKEAAGQLAKHLSQYPDDKDTLLE